MSNLQVDLPYVLQEKFTDSDIKSLLHAYRSAVETHTKMKHALVAFPDLEGLVGAPLLARQESRVQAAETTLLSVIKKAARAHG